MLVTHPTYNDWSQALAFASVFVALCSVLVDILQSGTISNRKAYANTKVPRYYRGQCIRQHLVHHVREQASTLLRPPVKH